MLGSKFRGLLELGVGFFCWQPVFNPAIRPVQGQAVITAVVLQQAAIAQAVRVVVVRRQLGRHIGSDQPVVQMFGHGDLKKHRVACQMLAQRADLSPWQTQPDAVAMAGNHKVRHHAAFGGTAGAQSPAVCFKAGHIAG